MNNSSFFWEIKDILTQFVAAFDDTTIKRYDGNRLERQKVSVRYVFAPKQRVIYDIVNKAQNITLPVVAIDVKSISRDSSRVFNKVEPSYYPGKLDENGFETIAAVSTPVPINIEVSMTIISKYMNDMDQIVSNFVPYNNPYIILAWQVPEAFNLGETHEIRSEVLWNGNLTYNTPTDISYTDKYRISVDTSFTIKTWLFKETKPVVPIFRIDQNFNALTSKYDLEYYSNFEQITANSLTTDVVTISGVPQFTNMFYNLTGSSIQVDDSITVRRKNPAIFTAYGTNFDLDNATTNYYLSSNVQDMFGTEAIVGTNYGPISGYALNDNVIKLDNGTITINLPTNSLKANGDIKFVAVNPAGFAVTDGFVSVIE